VCSERLNFIVTGTGARFRTSESHDLSTIYSQFGGGRGRRVVMSCEALGSLEEVVCFGHGRATRRENRRKHCVR
jgi:hypothetical protein